MSVRPAILAWRAHLRAQAPDLFFPKLFWAASLHALQNPEAATHFCWFGVSLQVSNCIATGIVPKNFCWLGKRKHVSMTACLHDLRGYRSSRFPIANYRKSPVLEDDSLRIQHLYIPSFDPCSYQFISIPTYINIYQAKRPWNQPCFSSTVLLEGVVENTAAQGQQKDLLPLGPALKLDPFKVPN